VLERIEGSGLLYQENDSDDLAQQLLRLSSPEIRLRMGETGMRRVRTRFSWNVIAQQRLQDYEEALRPKAGQL
jgi:glycosyltransferase involved in cell wall biosynthesis